MELTLRAAKAIGTTAGYIQTRDVQEMIGDAEAARRNPVPALIGAAALGLVLGHFFDEIKEYEAVT